MSELVSTGAHATPCEAACHLRPGPTRWVVRTGQILILPGSWGRSRSFVEGGCHERSDPKRHHEPEGPPAPVRRAHRGRLNTLDALALIFLHQRPSNGVGPDDHARAQHLRITYKIKPNGRHAAQKRIRNGGANARPRLLV